jgi:hypothetical protein
MRSVRTTFYAEDLHVIRAVLIIILFWVSASYLADSAIMYIHKKYDIKLWKLHTLIVVFVLIIILVDPHTFERI